MIKHWVGFMFSEFLHDFTRINHNMDIVLTLLLFCHFQDFQSTKIFILQSYANQANVQWHKDQWYRIKSPEKKKLLFMVNWFLKRAQLIQCENNNHFKNWCWDHWISMYKRIELNPFLTRYTKINVNMDYRPRSKN